MLLQNEGMHEGYIPRVYGRAAFSDVGEFLSGTDATRDAARARRRVEVFEFVIGRARRYLQYRTKGRRILAASGGRIETAPRGNEYNTSSDLGQTCRYRG